MKNLKQYLLDYCKSQGKNLVDIKKEFLGLSLSLYKIKDCDNNDPKLNKDLFKFHKKIVQETIDFIRSNPEIQKIISSKKEEISKEILEESRYKYIPNLRICFEADNLEESIISGEWTPSTDSSLGIYLGNVNVIFSA